MRRGGNSEAGEPAAHLARTTRFENRNIRLRQDWTAPLNPRKATMIRTTLSFCLLFGGLLVVSKCLHTTQGQATHSPPATHGPASEMAEPARFQPVPSEAAHDSDLIRAADANPIQLVAYENATVGDEPPKSKTAPDEAVGDVLNRLRPSESDDATIVQTDEPTEPAEGPSQSIEPEIALTPELVELRGRLRECLAYYYFRPENVAIRSPWGAMHAMIAYGVDSELIVGDRRVNAIGYLCYNGVCNGQQLFYTANGRLQTRIGPGVQGHPGQFLAMLAQSRVKTDFPMLIDGQKFTVADLIQHEKETCRPRTELTFKLIAFMHYLKSDEQWRSNDGQTWDIPRLIKEELAQPIVGAACGGTHRMTGFSYAVRKREQRNEPFTGQWMRAQKFVQDYHDYAFKLQNPDASFSTDWFAGRADFGPVSRRLETTGHITEWLAYSLDKEQLVEPRMIRSVSYLTNLLSQNRGEKSVPWGMACTRWPSMTSACLAGSPAPERPNWLKPGNRAGWSGKVPGEFPNPPRRP
jgi:hypothetical protein